MAVQKELKLEEIVKPDYKLHIKEIHYMGSWRHTYFSVSFDEPGYFTDKAVKNVFAAFRKAIRAYRHSKRDGDSDRHAGVRTSGCDWVLTVDILAHFEDWLQITAPINTLMKEAAERWQERVNEQKRFDQPANHSLQVNFALQTFGLSSDATLIDVKKQYRTLVKQHHPDAGGDAEKFKKINNANEVLMQYFS
jgi:hypothetical protein